MGLGSYKFLGGSYESTFEFHNLVAGLLDRLSAFWGSRARLSRGRALRRTLDFRCAIDAWKRERSSIRRLWPRTGSRAVGDFRAQQESAEARRRAREVFRTAGGRRLA